MNELVMEWVEKAEGDSRTAEREGTVGEGPNYDAVCFHAQQCAEKYLKAFLTSRVTTYQGAPGQALSKTRRRHAPVAQAARPVFAG